LRAVRARLAILAVLAIAGCGGDDSAEPAAEPASTPTPNPTTPAEPTASAEPGSAANAFIGSLAVDPGDGTLMIGTGLGLFRAERGASRAKRVVGELTTPDGAGPVSSNLVVRYAGPGELLGSGHPEGEALPENLGLIRSGDGGDTWEPVSQLGDADFHIIQARGDRVVAVRAEEIDIQVSSDGGGRFDTRTPPDTPLDVAFDPEHPERMVMASQQGTFSSDDEGNSWRPRDPVPSEQLAWAAPDALYRSDPGGQIKVSADGGATWKERGNVGLSINELAADDEGNLYASVPGGEVHRSTDGGATWKRLLRLE
jgi:hypothetical protein